MPILTTEARAKLNAAKGSVKDVEEPEPRPQMVMVSVTEEGRAPSHVEQRIELRPTPKDDGTERAGPYHLRVTKVGENHTLARPALDGSKRAGRGINSAWERSCAARP